MSGERTRSSGWATLATLAPGLVVALGAAAATAHGLFEVVLAAKVPALIAWIYPVITDGLAIVAYASTGRLPRRGRCYAWAVVILAAGLSGLAQAVYLAGGVSEASSAAGLPAAMRFGVGAWPAVAAAIVAHLLFMLAAEGGLVTAAAGSAATGERVPAVAERADASTDEAAGAAVQSTGVQSGSVQSGAVQLDPLDASSAVERAERTTREPESVQPPAAAERGAAEAKPERPASPPPSPKRDRARAAARRWQAQHGDLPTVDQLMQLAEVSRGTAGTALQELREQPAPLQLITELPTSNTHS
ncbi:hypothetical protein [Amycolatopsis australiensis]|uniref:DUF2637 domain-containing protein n=1 Tax=Amycolatopsis australiensis TaxID=546364 RepID=A0A1K1PSB7_9PSEU|nr:hypothetical protein [Amycolatopsis australiensis]SFW50357.1 hypothetical protein SAMN04489730_0940 [Amycolatopsis australiensis]